VSVQVDITSPHSATRAQRPAEFACALAVPAHCWHATRSLFRLFESRQPGCHVLVNVLSNSAISFSSLNSFSVIIANAGSSSFSAIPCHLNTIVANAWTSDHRPSTTLRGNSGSAGLERSRITYGRKTVAPPR